jgi:hypothetical protein
MSNSVHSIQAAHTETQTKEAVQPPKTLQTEAAIQNKAPQDIVAISQEARQALARKT